MSKVNILLVDDNPDNLKALEAVLSSTNYNLIKANSGEEALKWVLKCDNIALILLDVQMPGMNGFETARLIKAREKSKFIPIVFITAINQASEHVQLGYKVDGFDYIFKPIDPEVLVRKVEIIVRSYIAYETVKEQKLLLQERTRELEKLNKELLETTSILKKTEALTRVITEVSTNTLLVLDTQGIILNANPAVEKMFGYTQQEIIGERVSRLLPQISMLQNSNIQSMETIGFRKDRTEFPVNLTIGQTQVDDQAVIVYTIRDITESKRIEKEKSEQFERLEKLVEERTREICLATEKLRISEDRFRKTFLLSPYIGVIRSLKDGIILNTNMVFEELTGYTYEEVKGHNIKFIEAIEVDSQLQPLPPSITYLDQIVKNLRITYRTKSGQIRDGLLSNEILEIGGEQCILSVVNDITDHLALEREMARLDRLDLIGEMAAGIAHEIRNPMTTVRGFLQMMGEKPQHIEASEFFDLMIQELDRANSIITEFLTLSKDHVVKLSKMNLNDLIKTLFPLFQADAFNARKDVQIELTDIPDLELDERGIRQMILNLVRNGLEAMQEDRKLTIRTYREENEVVLEVADQGTGIKPELIQKIGTPFLTTKEDGTGLGLAVCYGIAEKHKARITFDTSKKGTTFYVRFPCLNNN